MHTRRDSVRLHLRPSAGDFYMSRPSRGLRLVICLLGAALAVVVGVVAFTLHARRALPPVAANLAPAHIVVPVQSAPTPAATVPSTKPRLTTSYIDLVRAE